MEPHAGETGQVVIGYLPARVRDTDFFSIALRGWWDAMFQEMWKPGHRFTFRDLLSGNFSLERGLFDAVGGFETQLRCHEDYELGLGCSRPAHDSGLRRRHSGPTMSGPISRPR
jgi:hypothetical protein